MRKRKLPFKLAALVLTLAMLITSIPLYAFAAAESNALQETPGIGLSEPESATVVPDAPDDPDVTEKPEIPDKGEAELSILYELSELREESIKHFMLSDGSCMAVMYGVPVHELDAEGQWSDIDNSLVLSYNKLMTKDGRVSFSKNVNEDGEIYTLSEGDTGITIGLVGAYYSEGIIQEKETAYSNALEAQKMNAVKNVTSSLIYRDILKDTDIEYIVSNGAIKENILVKEKSDEYIYSFSLQLEGLTPYFDEYGNVLLIDSEEIVKYTIPAPVVYDSYGDYADDGIAYYTVEESEDGFVLTVTVDADWMNDGSRAYPVTIDPTVTATSTASATLDTYLDSSQPDTSKRTKTFISIGHGVSGQEYIGYWELTALPQIPSDSYVTDASVCFKTLSFQQNNTGISQIAINAHQITTSWTSYITWNEWQLGYNGQFASTPLTSNSVTVTTSLDDAVFNITSLTRDWYSGIAANYGIVLRQNGTTGVYTQLYSSDAGLYSNNLPVFTVTYLLYTDYSITLSQNTATIGQGGTLQLGLLLNPSGPSVTWESSDTIVATVSSTGLVTAVSPGSATIYARLGSSVYDTCSVTVTQYTMSLIASTDHAIIGDSVTFSVTVNPSTENLTWALSYGSGGFVVNSGNQSASVTISHVGKITVRVTAPNGQYTEKTLYGVALPYNSIYIMQS